MRRAALLVLSIATACSGAFAAEAAFRFDGRNYFLQSPGADSANGLREYLTKGENFDHWTRLMSVRRFDGLNDPVAYAQALVKQASSSGPNARGRVLQNEDAGSCIADFLVFSPEDASPSFAEWNLMRISKSGNALEVVQYARRFYKIDDSTAQELNADRERILPLLSAFKIPSGAR